MKQLVHAPSFLIQYQRWWLASEPRSIADIEFAVLILQICQYATQFLPSHIHTSDSISGLTLLEIRKACTEAYNRLSEACIALDWKGSLARVQHLLFAALVSSCEGRTDQFWEGIGAASQAAQKAGIQGHHCDSINNSELDKEMCRRVYCSLYVLDRSVAVHIDRRTIADTIVNSHLSRQLDRIPFVPNDLVTAMLPRMHLATDENVAIDSGAPELFTERLMQVQLGRFWRRFKLRRNSEYDPTQAEQAYEQFCTEYIPSLPPTFALKPDTKWDRSLPRLAMQRQILYIAIFDSICWNFRPLLILTPNQIAGLPLYKQVLLQTQKRVLAFAALRELDAIAALHSMFFGCLTRFAAIIFNSFEASVLLVVLCTCPDFLMDSNDDIGRALGLQDIRLTQKQLIEAARGGLERLQLLAEVSDMAASGARTLAQLFSNFPGDVGPSLSSMGSDGSGCSASLPTMLSDFIGSDLDTGFPASSIYQNTGLMAEALQITMPEDFYLNPQAFAFDFVNTRESK